MSGISYLGAGIGKLSELIRIIRIIKIVRIFEHSALPNYIRKNMFSKRPEMHGLSSHYWQAQPGRKSTESASCSLCVCFC